jgi:alkanesulfonate monooxygenase SsuD/methylene tetrahydromethanopterin reductase-like flavin-dependent oxidoreductase (luciferase family)
MGDQRDRAEQDERIGVGVFVPTREAYVGAGWNARRLIDFAVRAEELGYASLSVTDTMTSTRLEPVTVLSAVSTATERILLTTGAIIPAVRQPLNAAHALASLDVLSEGRLAVTVGAGFPGRSDRELAMVGVPMRGRFVLLDDIVALWKTLWSSPRATSFHGKVLAYADLPEIPLPHRPGGPPVWLAGVTPKALDRTGRLYDGWLPYPPDPADYAAGYHALEAARSAAGRPPRAVTPALMATVVVEPDPDRARQRLEAYCQGFYGSSLDYLETIQVLVGGTEHDIAARLAPYVAAGARHILLRLAALDADDQFDQLERIGRSPLLGLPLAAANA